MKKLSFLALALCVGFSTGVSAQDAGGRDVRVVEGDADSPANRVGPYGVFSVNYALNYEGENFNGTNLETKLGYDFNRNVAAELETGWLVFDADDGNTDIGEVHMVPLLINGVVKAPVLEDRLVPYGSAGFGVFFFGFNEGDDIENTNIEIDIDNAAVGFKVAVGADYWLNHNWAMNFETGYFFIPDPDVTVSNGTTFLSGDAEVDTWYVGGGFKYKFG